MEETRREMEMRANVDIERGEDVTPLILPLAFSLSDSFLPSHCSACFHPLNPRIPLNTPNNPIFQSPSLHSCDSHCKASVRYCSRECFHADSHLHLSSGECRLFLSLQSRPATWQRDDSSQLRMALRLLLSLEGSSPAARRIGGLMTNREKFEGDAEILERIRDGGRMMALARGRLGPGEEMRNPMEESVLCQVLTNAVEVQVNEGRAVGTAIYGPCFSWFNHSCVPNACYSFSLTGSDESDSSGAGFLVSAHGEEATREKWIFDERKLKYGLCKNGPRIIVRSIKPIKKGEEVCVTYIDLLQPKGNVANFHSSASVDHSFYRDEVYEELNDCLYQAIDDVSSGNPKACCERLEIMLAEGFRNQQLWPGENLQPNSKLHPLHHLSLNAFITLASAYRIRADSFLAPDLAKDNQLKAFELSRAAAAYSVLLAAVTHHLFLSEASLIAPAAHFWVSAGESLLGLVRSPTWSPFAKNRSMLDLSDLLSWRNGKCLLLKEPQIGLVCGRSRMQTEGSKSWGEFDEICQGFLDCVTRISVEVWPFLICGLDYLKDIKDPVDFRWLVGLMSTHTLGEAQVVARCPAERCIEEVEERMRLLELAAHCFLFGGFLSGICYGPCGYLSVFVRNLLQYLGQCLLESDAMSSDSEKENDLSSI
ncbi:protein SET DOMAIN GROUP 41 isoform X2 [Magnolia sinica]|uniref:protein SET DOMAIN GROUP 41 isoform X2 n=1 Tax=Magnolia sinica TaxID=86752 RepID=UPI00265968CB|nr:protein SET DOMAIN GROUP 41 isoform X2 [Magnolia sinica]